MDLAFAIGQLERFLEDALVAGKGMIAHVSTQQRMGSNSSGSASPFFGALALSSLASAPRSTSLTAACNSLAQELWQQQSRLGSFNYWARDSEAAQCHPYPDDADTTSCVLSAITAHDRLLIDGEVLAKYVMLLTAVEEQPSGPYRTWFVPPESDAVWKDVDIVVNANIAYALSLHDVRLTGLDTYLANAISEGRYRSPYYPSEVPIIFFLARANVPHASQKLLDDLFRLRQSDGGWGCTRDTACGVISALYLGCAPERVFDAIRRLLQEVIHFENGEIDALCIDSVSSGETRYAGSLVLDAAFCREALIAYDLASQRMEKASEAQAVEEQNVLQRIQTILEARRSTVLSLPLQERMVKIEQRIMSSVRGQEIPLLAYRFHASLADEHRCMSLDDLAELGAVNVYGWSAYTLFDDVMDEDGRVCDLPLAIFCVREVMDRFHRFLPQSSEFYRSVCGVSDGIDAANAWEMTTCRLKREEHAWRIPEQIPSYGEYSVLAERSLGHALGPVAVLYGAGYGAGSPELQNLFEFFRHYLIGKQLDDDAHDWEEDMKKGQVNSVGALLLMQWREQHPTSAHLRETDFLELRSFFWNEVLCVIAKRMQDEADAALLAWKRISIIQDHHLCETLLAPIRLSAEKALREQREAIRFLHTYQGHEASSQKGQGSFGLDIEKSDHTRDRESL